LATQLQRRDTALEGTREQTSKDVLDRPFYGAFCHIHRLLAQPVGLVAKGRWCSKGRGGSSPPSH
jgi:hypothetical protein